jgi:hypothetical protein
MKLIFCVLCLASAANALADRRYSSEESRYSSEESLDSQEERSQERTGAEMKMKRYGTRAPVQKRQGESQVPGDIPVFLEIDVPWRHDAHLEWRERNGHHQRPDDTEQLPGTEQDTTVD